MSEEQKDLNEYIPANTLLEEMRSSLKIRPDSSMGPVIKVKRELPEKCPLWIEDTGRCEDHSDHICDNPKYYITCPPYLKRQR